MQISLKQINEAAKRLENVALKTPLQFSKRLSEKYGANIYLKREDLQEVRSYKIRGAYNKISSLSEKEKNLGVVTASAGNHAQGVAYSCFKLKIYGTIFMPVITPLQKIDRVKHFGGKYIDIKLDGQTYDDSAEMAHIFSEKQNAIYVHAFDDPLTIAGQGTVGKEIVEQMQEHIEIVIAPIGGGGFISGLSSYLKLIDPKVKIFGVEPNGASAMYNSLRENKIVTLSRIDYFVDGCAVKTVGKLPFKICQKNLEKVVVIPEGKVCNSMIAIYQNEGIIAEPAGALPIAALETLKPEIKNKNVVCIVSGGNNDISRYPEIMERSLVYKGLKHYFIIEFAQKPGQLRKFLDDVLGTNDDIVRFEYMKKTNKEKGAALVGIELKNKRDLDPLINRFKKAEFNFHKLSSRELLYNYII